jgi:hypothetical protein
MLQRIWQTTEPPTDVCVDLQAPMTLLSKARAPFGDAGFQDQSREVASERGGNSLATSL